MVVPLVVLAVGAIAAGYIGLPGAFASRNHFEHFLRPAIAEVAEHEATVLPDMPIQTTTESHGTEIWLTVVSSIIALGGLGIGFFVFLRKPLWQPPRLLEQKYHIDEVYDAAIVEPIKEGSTRLLWKIIDVRVIDGAVNGTAALAAGVGGLIRHLQSGLARSYVAIVVFGALLIIGYFVIR